MFCKKCGVPIDEGELCGACGASAQENSPTPVEPSHAAGMTVTNKKKNPIIAVIVAIVAVFALVVFLIGRGFGSGALKSYQSLEHKTLETLKAHATNMADFTGTGSASTSLLLTLTDDGKSLINDMDAGWLNSMSLDIQSVSDEAKAHSTGTFQINDKKIIDFEVLTELPGNEIFLKLPEFSPQYIKTRQNSDYMKLFSSSSPDMDAVKAVIDRYGAIIIDNLDKVERSKETVTVGSTSATYKTYVVTIDREISDNIANVIAGLRTMTMTWKR